MHWLAINYGLNGQYGLAIKSAWDAFGDYAAMFNIKPDTLWDYCLGNNNLLDLDKEGWLDDLVDNVVRANFVGEEWGYEKMKMVRKQLARQGFPSSVKYCNKNGISF